MIHGWFSGPRCISSRSAVLWCWFWGCLGRCRCHLDLFLFCIYDKNLPGSECLVGHYSTLYPIGSMYGIFTHIYHKNQPNVGVYTIHGSYGYLLPIRMPLPRISILLIRMLIGEKPIPTRILTLYCTIHHTQKKHIWWELLSSILPFIYSLKRSEFVSSIDLRFSGFLEWLK